MTGPATDSGRTPVTGPDGRSASFEADTTADTKEFSRPRLDERTVVMSAQPGFQIGWRGYDRGQVDTYRSRVENDLASARSAHERAVRDHAQAAERLRAAQNDLVRLRAQLTNGPSAVSGRLREILDIAAQEANQIRSDAQTDADEIRARATNDAQTIVRQAHSTAETILNEARAEQQQLGGEIGQVRTEARQQLDRARTEAEQARERADAEAALRRDAADRHAREQRQHADADAAARLVETNEQLAELTRHQDEARATLTELHEAIAKTLETSAASIQAHS